MNKILILDFGSQYTQLIARRIREQNVYCEIHPCNIKFSEIENFGAKALILSGGPESVLSKTSPKVDKRVFELGIPVLGICYGMQLITHLLGGKVVKAKHREYGKAHLKKSSSAGVLLQKVKSNSQVWMSHGDSIVKLPKGFSIIGKTNNGVMAAISNEKQKIYGLQFHPEVVHSQDGKTILNNFLFKIAKLKADWNMKSYIKIATHEIQEKVGKDHVILGLSGGVDSSVAAILIHQAIGKQLTCIFINNGVLRLGEAEKVKKVFKNHYNIKLKYIDASKLFLDRLKGVADPERKRKIIGRTFVEVFRNEAKKIKRAKFLAQGTLYPDVIESVSFKGPSVVIKSHHNVGGLPKRMGLKLLEPFRELFKDEVREIGKVLKMPDEIIHRHPFPGPGLAIRVLGSVSKEKLDLVKAADKIILDEIKSSGWYGKVWQAFAVLLPVKSVGVMGDERTYESTCAVRVVQSIDGMTADWVDLPHDVLGRISNRIINEVRGINRVVYDITSKPPGTIEWE